VNNDQHVAALAVQYQVFYSLGSLAFLATSMIFAITGDRNYPLYYMYIVFPVSMFFYCANFLANPRSTDRRYLAYLYCLYFVVTLLPNIIFLICINYYNTAVDPSVYFFLYGMMPLYVFVLLFAIVFRKHVARMVSDLPSPNSFLTPN
jgi:hypothetical protein